MTPEQLRTTNNFISKNVFYPFLVVFIVGLSRKGLFWGMGVLLYANNMNSAEWYKMSTDQQLKQQKGKINIL